MVKMFISRWFQSFWGILDDIISYIEILHTWEGLVYLEGSEDKTPWNVNHHHISKAGNYHDIHHLGNNLRESILKGIKSEIGGIFEICRCWRSWHSKPCSADRVILGVLDYLVQFLEQTCCESLNQQKRDRHQFINESICKAICIWLGCFRREGYGAFTGKEC